MDKHAEDFQPVGPEDHLDGQGYYTEADIDRIIATCPTGLPETMVDFPTSTPDGSETVLVPTDRRTVLRIRLNDSVDAPILGPVAAKKSRPPPRRRSNFNASRHRFANHLMRSGCQKAGTPTTFQPEFFSLFGGALGGMGRRIGGFPHYPADGPDQRTPLGSHAPAAVRDVIQGLQYLWQWSAEAKANAKQEMRPRGKAPHGRPAHTRSDWRSGRHLDRDFRPGHQDFRGGGRQPPRRPSRRSHDPVYSGLH